MPAPTATIVGPLVYPGNSRKVAVRSVTATCVGPEGAVLRDSGGGMVGETTVFTDAGGDFSIDLTLNSDIDEASGVGPPGTYWRLTVGVRPAVSWLVRLDAADADATVVIGDAAHTVVDPTPRGWVPIQGEPGALPAALEAARPAASAVPAGTQIFTPDSTTTWESDGTSWQRRGRPTVEHVWARDGITGWSEMMFNTDDNGSSTPNVLSVAGSRGRLARASAVRNYRAAWVRSGTLWEDSIVRSTWYGPPTWASPQNSNQAGHIHRAQPLEAGSGLRGVVVSWNIALGVINQLNLGVWNSTSIPATVYISYGAAFGATTTPPMIYQPQILAVERLQVAGVWTNRYYVADPFRYAVGDKVQVNGCLDTTFNATTQGAALTINKVTRQGAVISGQPVATIETSTPQTSAVTKKFDVGQLAADWVSTATTPKWISPINVASMVVGTKLWLKAWRTFDREPDWSEASVMGMDFSGALTDTGGAAMETPTGRGLCGIIGDHLSGGGYLEYGDFRAERL